MFDTEKVKALAHAQLAGDAEAGAALCVIVDGQEVLSETWGVADATQGRPYTAQSLQITMSMAKGVMGTLLAILVDRGLLEPDAPVSKYWPEFGAADKQAITVAQLFSHQAGLPLLDGNQSLALAADREALSQALATQAPLWPPGSAHGYHAITLGSYADILFERASGRSMCALLAEFGPQMGAEIYCGLPLEHWHRAVRILPALPLATPAAAPAIEPGSLPFRVVTNMPEYLGDPQAFFNGEGIRKVCLPGTNMFSNARSLARLYAGLLAGGVWGDRRLSSPEAIATVTAERVRGIDLVNHDEMAYGLAFQRPCRFSPFSPSRSAYGHCGVGGSLAFADPERGLTMAWIPSRFSAQSFDQRAQTVIDAVYAAL